VIILDALEKLYTAILQRFPNERITTKQAADAVGLTRGVTSSKYFILFLPFCKTHMFHRKR